MDILNVLKRLRDDLRAWVTNNLNALDAKIDNLTGAEAVGQLDDLCTKDKSSVVAAINEVASNIDATLSIPGAAADAKAVGDALEGKLDKTGGTISGHLDVTGGLEVAGVTYFRNLLITDGDGVPAVSMRAGGWVDGPEYGLAGVLHCHSETDIEQPIIIRGIMNPIDAADAANKAYVDDAISEVRIEEMITAKVNEAIANIYAQTQAGGTN